MNVISTSLHHIRKSIYYRYHENLPEKEAKWNTQYYFCHSMFGCHESESISLNEHRNQVMCQMKHSADYTLLKPKRHSLRCDSFMVHALLLRMRTNVVYFRVMRRLCRREWNWLWNRLCVNQHSWDPWQRTRDYGVWRLTLTAYRHQQRCGYNIIR